jgi:hypothetical protein
LINQWEKIVGKTVRGNNPNTVRFGEMRKAEKARRKAEKKANKDRKAA